MIDKWHKLGVNYRDQDDRIDHIDCAYAKKRNGVIHITYSPAAVADYTIMLMLMELPQNTVYHAACADSGLYITR